MQEENNRVVILNDLSVAISEEDHTLMNPLRWAVSNNWVGDRVEFCGYTVPHPSDKICNFNIQFEDKNVQSSKNVLKKIYEGLECVELIFSKLLVTIEKESVESGHSTN